MIKRFFKRIAAFFRNWKAADSARLQLDALLAHADPFAPLAERNTWLIEVSYWLHRRGRIVDEVEGPARARQVARLRYLLNVLDRNPEWKDGVSGTLNAIFRDLDAVALLCDTGLPQNPGYWSELRERLILRFIPPTPNTTEWAAMLTLLFPEDGDARWVEQIDAETWGRVLALFSHGAQAQGAHFNRDIGYSVQYLVSQIRASGFTQAIRSRIGIADFGESPFLPLVRSVEALLAEHHSSAGELPEALLQRLNVFRGMLEECRVAVQRVFDHLDENGVSVDIVFQVERVLARIRRIDLLLEVWLHAGDARVGTRMLADLIRSHQDRLSVASLSRRSFARLARKVVERSAETGEHYIARDRAEYRGMLGAAMGGGAMTAITAYLKFAIVGLHLPKLAEGLLSAFNYAGSFVTMQAVGFTLATKQPAMTAPALAEKLENIGRPEGMEEFVHETVCLIRSQFAAIFGNLIAVTPIALLIQFVAVQGLGHGLLTPQKAQATVESFSLLGPTPFYAAFTGVLLWISSLCAGWADNWFVYRRIGDVIAYHRRLRFVLGEQGALRAAAFWRNNISGLVANVSLGFLLALAPMILSALLPFELEVRHVTLSTGSLAAAAGILGPDLVYTRGFWLAVGGIATMGFLNLGVSFALAFQLALRARDLRGVQRRAVYRAVAMEILRRPLSVLMVPKSDAERFAR